MRFPCRFRGAPPSGPSRRRERAAPCFSICSVIAAIAFLVSSSRFLREDGQRSDPRKCPGSPQSQQAPAALATLLPVVATRRAAARVGRRRRRRGRGDAPREEIEERLLGALLGALREPLAKVSANDYRDPPFSHIHMCEPA